MVLKAHTETCDYLYVVLNVKVSKTGVYLHVVLNAKTYDWLHLVLTEPKLVFKLVFTVFYWFLLVFKLVFTKTKTGVYLHVVLNLHAKTYDWLHLVLTVKVSKTGVYLHVVHNMYLLLHLTIVNVHVET